MPRPALKPSDRAASVAAAVGGLPSLVRNATELLNVKGATHADTLAAWEAVEQYGATVHRQARLLAGKSKGG